MASLALSVLVSTAFLVVFLTRTPRRRGLTLAMIGCAICVLVSSSWILIRWTGFGYDYFFEPVNWALTGLQVTQSVLWIVALYMMLYRDNTELPSSLDLGQTRSPARPKRVAASEE